MVDALDEAGRVVELSAFGQQGLVEQHSSPVIEVLGFSLQSDHHRMLRIDFQYRQRFRYFLAGSLEHARHVAAHIVLVRHEAGRGVGQAMGDANFLDAPGKTGFDLAGQFLVLACLFFLILFLGFIFECTQIQPALGNGYQGLFLEFSQ